jgi:hypothetical protein
MSIAVWVLGGLTVTGAVVAVIVFWSLARDLAENEEDASD